MCTYNDVDRIKHYLPAAGWVLPLLRFTFGIAISKSYLLTYPDGSKEHIGRAKRDDLLLSGSAKQIAPEKYLFTDAEVCMKSFADLSRFTVLFEPLNLRRFLEGSFIIERGEKRQRELLETPEAMVYRMNQEAAKQVSHVQPG